MKTAIEVLKDYYDKDNIFQSVKMAMEEYSSLQNRSLVEENKILKNQISALQDLINALSYKEGKSNG